MRTNLIPLFAHVGFSIGLAATSLTVHARDSASELMRVDEIFAASLATSNAENAARAARLQIELKQQIAAFERTCGSVSVAAGELPAVVKGVRNGLLLAAAPGHFPREQGFYAVDFDRHVFVKVTQYLAERMAGPTRLFGDAPANKSCRLLRLPNGQTRLEVVAELPVAPGDTEAVRQLVSSLQERRGRAANTEPSKSSGWDGCSGARLSSAIVVPFVAGKRLPDLCAEVGDKDLGALFDNVAHQFRQTRPGQ